MLNNYFYGHCTCLESPPLSAKIKKSDWLSSVNKRHIEDYKGSY